MKSKGKTKTIEDLLEKNPRGLTIQDIADKTRFNRNTVAVHIAELRGMDKIYIREVGNAKIHYLKKGR